MIQPFRETGVDPRDLIGLRIGNVIHDLIILRQRRFAPFRRFRCDDRNCACVEVLLAPVSRVNTIIPIAARRR